MKRVDVAIVGAGMAGASLAAELAPHASVLMIEAEAMPGYHATGRSAAFWVESYGGPGVQPLTSASGDFLRAPPVDFSETGFLTHRGALHLAGETGSAALDAFARRFAYSGVPMAALDEAAIRQRLPGLRAGPWRALIEPRVADIDVAALHAAYLRAAKRAGAELLCSAPLRAAFRERGRWRIDVGEEVTIDAGVLVDAAGAWADDVAGIAGARPLGVTPYRRTIVQLRTDPPAEPDLPLVLDAEERFYFKPEPGGRLWLSPHDETPVIAGDVAPHEIDIATAIDRMGRVVDWTIARKERAWAGLRSFAPDRLPVYGFAREAPGFFWFAGQGGFGIQTAPAAAKLAASILLGIAPDPMVAGIDADRYRPQRFGG